MQITWQCCFLILAFAWLARSQPYTNIIKTASGLIQGTITHFYNFRVEQYLGIPFAKAPVRQLRFRKPHAMKPWSKILIADKPGPACVQYVDYPYPWYDMYGFKSEDCLYLNIWVPQSEQKNTKKPVMFWIHGGGYTVGSNQMELYDGLALASVGDIIVVTTNYRLSALGFLTSQSETAPGNVALYDVLEALKWINKNIAAFGGDPNRVTVAGEGVGAITAGIFCISPLTKGLFSRVIMESGSPAFLQMDNNTASMHKSQRLAEVLGCADDVTTIFNYPDKVVDCLREKNAFEIIIKENSFHPKRTIAYWPIYGDELIPILPRKALAAGMFHNVDVLIGNTRDEGAHLEATLKPDIFGIYGRNNLKVNKTFGESLIDDFLQDVSIPKEVVKEYYLGNITENNYDEIRQQVYTSIGDSILLCPTKYFAETYGQSENSVFYYYFVHRPSTSPWAEWMNVPHSEDVQFAFGQPLLNPRKYTIEEILLSFKVIEIWTNFVKYSSPVSPQQYRTNGYEWPLYSRKNPKYLTLNTEPMTYGEGPHQENCDFFRPYFGFDV